MSESDSDIEGADEPEEGADAPVGGEGLSPEVEWTPNFPRVRRVDHLWFMAEKYLCGAMFLFMTLMVFAGVLAQMFTGRRHWYYVLVLFGFVFLGVRTRVIKDGEKPLTWGASLIWAVAITVAVAGLTHLYIEEYPGGFVWAPKLALVMMLWVALLGASMATYERVHLALEFGEQLWPKRMIHYVRAFAHALTSAFCFCLFLLSMSLTLDHVDWGTNIKANEWLPYWLAVAIMPYTFIAMSIRIAAQSVTIAAKIEEPKEEQIPT
jgi:TRAP-type C4-dicarboxylate transport system permease small subunit